MKNLKALAFNILNQKIKELNILKELTNLLDREICEGCKQEILFIMLFYFKVDELDLIDTDYDDNE